MQSTFYCLDRVANYYIIESLLFSVEIIFAVIVFLCVSGMELVLKLSGLETENICRVWSFLDIGPLIISGQDQFWVQHKYKYAKYLYVL